jgi:hypothetical protein
MDANEVFDRPAQRRWWLLNKALETASFDDAIRLAQAAEDFVFAGAGRIAAVPAAAGVELPPAEPAMPEAADAAAAPDEAAEEATTLSSYLSVLATPDDVVRYLRQRDNVVVSAGEGMYLVNARFRESLAELVRRANRMRSHQKLPPFELLPAAPLPALAVGNGRGGPNALSAGGAGH